MLSLSLPPTEWTTDGWMSSASPGVSGPGVMAPAQPEPRQGPTEDAGLVPSTLHQIPCRFKKGVGGDPNNHAIERPRGPGGPPGPPGLASLVRAVDEGVTDRIALDPEKGVRLAQKMQVGPCTPVGTQP